MDGLVKSGLKAAQNAGETAMQMAQFLGARQRPLVLLIADDDAPARTQLAGEMRLREFVVHEDSSGMEAIETAELTQPDVILLDTRMPDTDGLDAIRDLKANPATANLPVIAMSPASHGGEREACLTAGAVAFLVKPVRGDQLASVILSLLGRASKQANPAD